MRIRLAIPDEGLRRALSDLLVDAGHEVGGDGAPSAPWDLVIRTESGGPRPVPDVAVLSLRPGPDGVPDGEPVEALARALREKGEAVWDHPLDPRRLLQALGQGARRPAPEDGPPYALTACAEPWLLLDPADRRVRWANHAALARLRLTSSEPERAALPRELAALVREVADHPEGRRIVDLPGGPVHAHWWTDSRGRRVLGLLAPPRAPAREAGDGDLRALAEIGRASSTLAHEIRNPLASLASAVDLLGGDLDAAERSEVARLAKERVARMRVLLDDTLRLARPFRGPPSPVDLVGVVASSLALARVDPRFASVDLRTDVATENAVASAYAEPLAQALTNLLINAAEAQGEKGRIVVRLTREGTRVVLRVIDEGPGIPAEHREKAFAPFWTTKSTGTGLGLAYVRRVAEACGGTARIEDAPRGACVRMDLPAA